jgi:hypothetical protein
VATQRQSLYYRGGSDNLRLDARGSACDDPRVNATPYDFDAGGVLRSLTLVWARPVGPAPAPIFNERVRLLSMGYAGGLTQSASRMQGQSEKARVVLQDIPERNLLLEACASPGDLLELAQNAAAAHCASGALMASATLFEFVPLVHGVAASESGP